MMKRGLLVAWFWFFGISVFAQEDPVLMRVNGRFKNYNRIGHRQARDCAPFHGSFPVQTTGGRTSLSKSGADRAIPACRLETDA